MEGDTIHVSKTETAYFKSFLDIANSTKIKKFLFPIPLMIGGTDITLTVKLKSNASFEHKIRRSSPYDENLELMNSDLVHF